MKLFPEKKKKEEEKYVCVWIARSRDDSWKAACLPADDISLQARSIIISSPLGTRVYVVANTRPYRKVYKRKIALFPRWNSKSHVEVAALGIISRIYDFGNSPRATEWKESGLLGKFHDLSPMLRLSSRSRNKPETAYLRKSLAQVSQSYHKTMESRSGNLASSAKSNSRVASASADKVTPLAVLFPLLSLFLSSFSSYIIPLLILSLSFSLSRVEELFLYFFPLRFLTPCFTVLLSFFSFSSSFFLFFFFLLLPLPWDTTFPFPLAFSPERIREYVFQRESWFPPVILTECAEVWYFFFSEDFSPTGKGIVYYGKKNKFEKLDTKGESFGLDRRKFRWTLNC